MILWFLVTQGFGFYLDRFASYEATYGTIASVIVFLFWLWLSNLALLLGAEINDVLAELRKNESPAAARLAEREKSPTEKATPPQCPVRTGYTVRRHDARVGVKLPSDVVMSRALVRGTQNVFTR